MKKPFKVTDPKQDRNNNEFYNSFSRQEGSILNINTGVGADTEFSVKHNLDYVPDQADLLHYTGETDPGAGLYLEIKPSGTAWTRVSAYLKCNTANANLRVRIS